MHVAWTCDRGNPALGIMCSWLLLATVGEIRGATGWERLSELRPGDRITVVLMDHKEQSGEFVRVSTENLYLRAKTGEVGIERAQIWRVTLRARSRRLRN